MSDHKDLPEGWEVAGYEGSDGWQNPEKGDPEPTDHDLIYSYQTVVSFEDENGDKQYYTIWGGVEDWDGLYDAIEHLIEMYG